MLGETSTGQIFQDVAKGEQRYLPTFTEDFAHREVGPTALLPFRHTIWYALRAMTAVLGPEGLMVCTETVNKAIDGHYS